MSGLSTEQITKYRYYALAAANSEEISGEYGRATIFGGLLNILGIGDLSTPDLVDFKNALSFVLGANPTLEVKSPTLQGTITRQIIVPFFEELKATNDINSSHLIVWIATWIRDRDLEVRDNLNKYANFVTIGIPAVSKLILSANLEGNQLKYTTAIVRRMSNLLKAKYPDKIADMDVIYASVTKGNQDIDKITDIVINEVTDKIGTGFIEERGRTTYGTDQAFVPESKTTTLQDISSYLIGVLRSVPLQDFGDAKQQDSVKMILGNPANSANNLQQLLDTINTSLLLLASIGKANEIRSTLDQMTRSLDPQSKKSLFDSLESNLKQNFLDVLSSDQQDFVEAERKGNIDNYLDELLNIYLTMGSVLSLVRAVESNKQKVGFIYYELSSEESNSYSYALGSYNRAGTSLQNLNKLNEVMQTILKNHGKITTPAHPAPIPSLAAVTENKAENKAEFLRLANILSNLSILPSEDRATLYDIMREYESGKMTPQRMDDLSGIMRETIRRNAPSALLTDARSFKFQS